MSLCSIIKTIAPIMLCSPKHPFRSTRRITYSMREEHVLVGSKFELFGRVPLVAIMEMGGKALRSSKKIHIRGDKTSGDIII